MILQQLDLLNHKVDAINSRNKQVMTGTSTPATEKPAAWTTAQLQHQPAQEAGSSRGTTEQPDLSSFAIPHNGATEGQNVLTWPVTKSFLRREIGDLPYAEDVDIPSSKWLADVTQAYSTPIVVDPRVDIVCGTGSGIFNPAHSVFLAEERVYEWCLAYFHSFHSIYPIIDRRTFESILLPRCQQHLFNENDEASALVLLVIALGVLAEEGTIGEPVTGASTGLRGGTNERPPGHIFVQEAMRRMGLMLSHHTVLNLQCHILCAIYFSQCSRNLEYWRMTQLSCTICKNLVLLIYDWGTFESDMISRLFWMCIVLESAPAGELGLKRSGLSELQDSIPLPSFTNTSEDVPETDEDLFVQYNFLAQITLRTLVDRVNNTLKVYRKLIR